MDSALSGMRMVYLFSHGNINIWTSSQERPYLCKP